MPSDSEYSTPESNREMDNYRTPERSSRRSAADLENQISPMSGTSGLSQRRRNVQSGEASNIGLSSEPISMAPFSSRTRAQRFFGIFRGLRRGGVSIGGASKTEPPRSSSEAGDHQKEEENPSLPLSKQALLVIGFVGEVVLKNLFPLHNGSLATRITVDTLIIVGALLYFLAMNCNKKYSHRIALGMAYFALLMMAIGFVMAAVVSNSLNSGHDSHS